MKTTDKTHLTFRWEGADLDSRGKASRKEERTEVSESSREGFWALEEAKSWVAVKAMLDELKAGAGDIVKWVREILSANDWTSKTEELGDVNAIMLMSVRNASRRHWRLRSQMKDLQDVMQGVGERCHATIAFARHVWQTWLYDIRAKRASLRRDSVTKTIRLTV